VPASAAERRPRTSVAPMPSRIAPEWGHRSVDRPVVAVSPQSGGPSRSFGGSGLAYRPAGRPGIGRGDLGAVNGRGRASPSRWAVARRRQGGRSPGAVKRARPAVRVSDASTACSSRVARQVCLGGMGDRTARALRTWKAPPAARPPRPAGRGCLRVTNVRRVPPTARRPRPGAPRAGGDGCPPGGRSARPSRANRSRPAR